MIRANALLAGFWQPFLNNKLVVGSSLLQLRLSVRWSTPCAADPQPVTHPPTNLGVDVSERIEQAAVQHLLNHTNFRQNNAAKRCLLKCKYTAALLKLLTTDVYQKLHCYVCTISDSAAVITSNLSPKTANARCCYRNPMTQCLGLGCS